MISFTTAIEVLERENISVYLTEFGFGFTGCDADIYDSLEEAVIGGWDYAVDQSLLSEDEVEMGNRLKVAIHKNKVSDKESVVPVKHWSIHQGDNVDDVKDNQFNMNIKDARDTSGQLYLDVMVEDPNIENYLSMVVEVNNLPDETEVRPMVAIGDGVDIMVLIYQVDDKLIVRPENGLNITNTVLKNGEYALILE